MRSRTLPFVALALAASAMPVLAADFPILRGTSGPSLPPAPMIEQNEPIRWDGFYLGGHAGMAALNFNPRNGASDLVAQLLRNTVLQDQFQVSRLIQPQQFSARGTVYGAFAGYNLQFGEAVVGLEADWTRVNRQGSGIDNIGRQYTTIPGFQESVSIRGGNTTRIDDVFTIRGRAGYAFGAIMPYMTAGVAFGYGRVSNFVDVTTQGRNLDPANQVANNYGPLFLTRTDARQNSFMGGFAAGAGVEATLGGLLLRAEYLYTRLQAQGGVTIDMNQGRLGAGVKF